MKRFNKSIAILLIIVFFISMTNINGTYIYAATTNTLQLTSQPTEWVVDEPNDYIYLLSKSEGILSFITLSTMQLENKITLGSNPTDIEMMNGKLYISMNGSNSIIIVDVATQTIEETINVTSAPYSIAVDSDGSIYYAEESQLCSIYAYDPVTRLDTNLTIGNYYYPDLAIDRTKGVLYIGESGSSGSNIVAVSTSDYVELHESKYNDSYGFSFPSRKVILNGEEVFYASHSLDSNNLAVINGEYTSDVSTYDENILYADANYVVTDSCIYNRNFFLPLTEFTQTPELAYVTTGGTVVIVSNTTIYKYDSLTDININYSIDKNYTDLVYDETADYLYVISDNANSLEFIRMLDMAHEEEIIVGSKPSDIEMVNDKLYISLFGSTKIAIVDTINKSIVSTFNVSQNPYKIAIDGDKLFYTTEDKWCYIYEYDLITGEETKLTSLGSYSEPDLEVDTINHVLYIGESGSSGSHIESVSTTDYSVLHKSTYNDGYGFPYPNRKVILDDNEIFYANRSLDASNLEGINGEYASELSYNEDIIYVDDTMVATSHLLYNRDTFLPDKNYEQIQSASYVKLAEMTSRGLFLVYDNNYMTFYNNTNEFVYNPTSIGKLLLDETNGYIYTIGDNSNNLKFIRLQDNQVEKEIYVGSKPSDMVQVNNSLYISLFGSTKIVVVDISTGTIIDITNVKQNPYKIAIDGDKLFYTTEDQQCYIYEYNLKTGVETKLTMLGLNYEPDLEVDTTNQVLYIGESGSSGSNIKAVSTVDYSVLHKSTYDDGYGFPFPNRKVILDGQEIFYGGHSLSSNNLTIINGEYVETYGADILAVSTNYVVTKKAIYERNTLTKVMELPFEATLAVISDTDEFYLYNSSDTLIYKYEGVIFKPSTIITKVSDTIQLEAYALFGSIFSEDSYSQSVTSQVNYYTADGNVVSINNAGLVTALSPGIVNITSSIAGKSNNVEVNVVSLSSIVPGKSNYELAVGEKDIITIDAEYALPSGKILLIEDVTQDAAYASSDSSVVTLDNIATITAVTSGQAIISVAYEDKNTQIDVTVTNPLVRLDVDQEEVTVTTDQVYQIDLSGINSDGNVVALTNGIMYSSSNSDIITVDSNGLVTAIAPGIATILAQYNGLDISINFTVIDESQHIKDEIISFYLHYYDNIYPGDSYQLRVIKEVFNGTDIEYVDVTGDATFSILDLELANIDSQLVFTALASGNVNLVGEYYDITNNETFYWDDVVITILEDPNAPDPEPETFKLSIVSSHGTVEIDPEKASYEELEEVTLTATPNEGYEFVSWSGDVTVTKSATIKIIMDSDKTIIANYKEKEVDSDPKPTPSPTPKEEPKDKTNVIDTDTVINGEYLLENIEEDTVTLVAEMEDDIVDITIELEALDSIIDEEDSYIETETGDYNYILPVSEIHLSDITEELDAQAQDIQIKIIIQKVVEEEKAKELAEELEVEIVTDLVDFKVEATNVKTGQKTEIEKFNSYVTRKITLPSIADANKLVGVIYNPDTGKFIPVPTLFKEVDGKVVALMKRQGNSIYTVISHEKSFNDIQNHWAMDDINLMASKMIINGKTEDTFSPNDNITRAEFVSLVTRALGLQTDANIENKFNDVNDQWFATDVNVLAATGIIGGYEDGSFRPYNNITREEVVSIISRAIKYVGKQNDLIDTNTILDEFSDNNAISEWAKESVAMAVYSEIICGNPQGEFSPQNNATRAVAASIIRRFLTYVEFMN